MACLPGYAAAQDRTIEDIFGILIRENAEGALAVLGIAAVPDDSASALFLDTGQTDRDFDFKASQLGGGFRLSENAPLYLEGYIGYNRFDPVLFLSGSGETSKLPLKWTSVAATGGIGYEFDITDNLKFRPFLNITLGRIQSDTSIGATIIADKLGLDTSFISGGGLTAGGLGGTLQLSYNNRLPSDHEYDLRARYTHLYLEPIAGDKDIVAEAEAATFAVYGRYRWPTGRRLFNRPVRGVVDASASYLGGDQGQILRTDWLARVGIGGEIDLSETFVPWVTTTRLMFRVTEGESVSGYSLGLGFSF